MNFKRFIPAVCLLLIAGGALSSCSDKKEKSDKEENTKPVVRIEKVGEEDVDQTATYTATVEPEKVNNISAMMSNRIKSINVDEGMRVSAGQVLATLDDVNTTNYEIQLDNARAQLRNVQRNYNRAVELLKIGGGTQQNVDQMEIQLTNAKNAVASAERTLRNARENTVLTSPIAGVVTARNYDPGDMTGALPILTVAQVNPLKIVINVSESEFSHVKKGMPAKVTIDTYGDEVFQGHVSLISPTIDTQSRTFGVEISINNSDNRVLPGMFGRVTLNFGNERHVVVPDRAVVKQAGSADQYVYTYSNGKVKYNKVELGQRLGDKYEIISGVAPGSDVVVTGQNRLSNGAEVTLAK